MGKSILASFLLAICAAVPAADRVVDKVRIIVNSSGRILPTEGRLYRIMEGFSTREFVANVAADGKLDAPYTCKSPARIWAEPRRQDVTTEEEPRPCGGEMVFQFHVPLFAQTSDFSKGVELSSMGKTAAAQRVFSEAAVKAAARGDDKTAAAASNAAIAAAATALGDTTLSKLVTRDVAQNKSLVLTKAGKDTLKEFQSGAKLEATGKLDFATQKAMEKMMK